MMYRRPARELHRSRSARPSRRRRRPPLGLVVAAVVVVAAAVAVPVLVVGSGASPSEPAPPASYEVVYQVVDQSAGTDQSRWEVLDVRDPLDVSDLTYYGNPLTGAVPETGTVTDYDGLYDLSGGRLTLVSHREPALGSGAVTLGVELPQLYQWGLAEDRHQTRTIAGQPCRVVRLSEPPAGPLTPLSGGDHDDVCLTSTGIELSEMWTYAGRVVLTRSAVDVYLPGQVRPIAGPPAGSGSTTAASDLIQVSNRAAPSFVADPTPPSGYSAAPSLSVSAQDPQQVNVLLYTASDWSFERGGELVTVEAGTGSPPWDDSSTATRPEHLNGLGPAEAVLRSDGPQLQVTLGDGRWVAIDGTIPLAQLVDYGSTLRLATVG